MAQKRYSLLQINYLWKESRIANFLSLKSFADQRKTLPLFLSSNQFLTPFEKKSVCLKLLVKK